MDVGDNIYYVYLYLREDGTPYYVGKGKGSRAYSRKRRTVATPDTCRIVFVAINLREEEAFSLEKQLISRYGRKDIGTGILRNLTDGGEGAAGAIKSVENRSQISARQTGELNHMFGKNISPEHKAAISRAITGSLNPNYGKSMPSEVRDKISAARRGKRLSDEHRIKISESNKNPSEETRRKMSSSRKGRIVSDETRAKISASKKGMSEEARLAVSKVHSGKITSPETKAKMSESHKRFWANKRAARQDLNTVKAS